MFSSKCCVNIADKCFSAALNGLGVCLDSRLLAQGLVAELSLARGVA